MSVEKKFYGYTADQKEISSYTLTNKSGMKAVLLDIGAVIESLLVPDKNGNLVDVVLGFGDPKLYLENNGSLGAVVGRHANRIANATYTLNGVTYKLVLWCRIILRCTVFFKLFFAHNKISVSFLIAYCCFRFVLYYNKSRFPKQLSIS